MIVYLSVPYGLLKLQVDECNASASFYKPATAESYRDS
jgi:hypothetical protein